MVDVVEAVTALEDVMLVEAVEIVVVAAVEKSFDVVTEDFLVVTLFVVSEVVAVEVSEFVAVVAAVVNFIVVAVVKVEGEMLEVFVIVFNTASASLLYV